MIHTETRNRIRLAVAAYAYEIANNPVMSDAAFDDLANQIDLSVTTARPDLDDFFHRWFTPDTGVWVHHHPEPDKLKRIYNMLTERSPDDIDYDKNHSVDLFGPLLVRPSPERIERCRRCRGNIHKFPSDGGCHC